MHEIVAVRHYAGVYALAYLGAPLLLLGGAAPLACAVLWIITWLRLVVAVTVNRQLRHWPPGTLGLCLLTGPVGALVLRRKLRTLLPPMTLRPRPTSRP